MRGFVPTPDLVVDLMVDKLFRGRIVTPATRVLDAGCGPGAFIDGIVRWANRNGCQLPRVVGIELDPRHVEVARARFAGFPSIEIWNSDFLVERMVGFDLVIGNPPYVPITSLAPMEREVYRAEFHSAKGRFDLYLLFFEQALRSLRGGGRLVFITPEKFTYVETARPLRGLLRQHWVKELHFLDESTFVGLVTYPLVSTVEATPTQGPTTVVARDGVNRAVELPLTGASWQPGIRGESHSASDFTLAAVAARISCGVATGADGVFVLRKEELPSDLRGFAYPTVSGKGLSEQSIKAATHRMLVPYRRNGTLLSEAELGALGRYLRTEGRRKVLAGRTCASRKPWYSFHETPQLRWMLGPKILCKDISAGAKFFADRSGTIVPRHSVYYIVPRIGVDLDELLKYLNSEESQAWLSTHCQRAANGYLRLQSTILKRLPVPRSLAEGPARLGHTRKIAS